MVCSVQDLREREIINLKDGARLGSVCDVEIDTLSGSIVSIVIYGKGRFPFKSGKPKDIKIKWDEGYRIIAFEYGGGEYLCVMCKLANAKTPMQKYQINSSDINNFIKEIWNDSYDVIYVGG
mgnify:CR=1 FL=1